MRLSIQNTIPADQITQLELCTVYTFRLTRRCSNAAKEKYIYALSLTPVEKIRVLELIQKTTNEIKCPFVGLDLSHCSVRGETSDHKQFFFDMQSSSDDNRKRAGGRQNNRPKIIKIDQEKCWFCLSSPDVEKHLVISIGDNFYLALVKGPINECRMSCRCLEDGKWDFEKALQRFLELCQRKEVPDTDCLFKCYFTKSCKLLNVMPVS